MGSNLFLYYKERTPGIAPDVLVVRGVAKRERRTFKLWEEGHAPFFVLEATSESTKVKDQNKNKTIYAAIGVEEYFLYDPLGEYLKPRLQGFRLTAQGYQLIPRRTDGSLASTTTGLLLRPEGARLRLVDAATGVPLLWNEEREAARKAAEERTQAAEERADREAAARQAAEDLAEKETAARRAAEERARALEAELARLRNEHG